MGILCSYKLNRFDVQGTLAYNLTMSTAAARKPPFPEEGDTLTDFLHRPARVLKKVGKEDVVLRRRGKPSIRLSLETRQVSTAAASAAVLARAEEAASILSAALDGVSELAARLPELLARRYAWIRFLPTDGRDTFAREYVETLQACASIGNTARLDEMLCAWKATAEVYADPILLAKLTGPLPAPTSRRVPRP
jgi:hypothetical protein